MKELINKMNNRARKTWSQVRMSFNMEDTDEDYKQWKEETEGIREEEGDEGLYEICRMEGIEVSDLENLLWYAFE